MPFRHPLLVLALAIGLSAGAVAEDSGHHEQQAHVHGIAHLTLAAEGAEVLVEFVSPAASLVGFEHAPRTADERETLRLAEQNLKTGETMIRFNTLAGCRLVEAQVDADLGDSDEDHHDSSSNHAHAGEGHADLSASYQFSCDRPDQLQSAAVGFFMGFPALERVLAEYAMADGQGGAELTPGNPVVSFIPFKPRSE